MFPGTVGGNSWTHPSYWKQLPPFLPWGNNLAGDWTSYIWRVWCEDLYLFCLTIDVSWLFLKKSQGDRIGLIRRFLLSLLDLRQEWASLVHSESPSLKGFNHLFLMLYGELWYCEQVNHRILEAPSSLKLPLQMEEHWARHQRTH